MLAGVWTWVRLPPAPFIEIKNAEISAFFLIEVLKNIIPIVLFIDGRHGIRTHARFDTPTAFPTRPLKPLE